MKRIMSALLASVAASAQRRVYGDAAIRKAINDYGGSGGYTQRSRGAPTKRKKHRNMLLVSKRTKRKHRRAARG